MATPKSNKKLIYWLAFGSIAMFGFGFALVPLYDVMCKQLGINGKTNASAQTYDQQQVVDKTRTINVEFVAQTAPGMSWDFGPTVNQIKVHPGELVTTVFFANNTSNKRMIAQAIPSVSRDKPRYTSTKQSVFVLPNNLLNPIRRLTYLWFFSWIQNFLNPLLL